MQLTAKLEIDKKTQDFLKTLEEPRAQLNPVFRDVALFADRELKRQTNKRTGTTARSWRTSQAGPSAYVITNDVMTDNRKHLIVDLLNYGRKEVRPKKAKALFIPLTPKGASGEGDYGLDFVYAKSAKAVPGSHYVDRIMDEVGDLLSAKVMDYITRL